MTNLVWYFIGVASGITVAHLFIILFRGLSNIILKPFEIGEITNVNGFGCWVLYIFIAICSPVIFLFKMIYLLTHIGNGGGRRNNNYETISIASNPRDVRRYDPYNYNR